MIDEVVQLQTGWLAHPQLGVNPIAQQLPRKRLGLPDDDAPPPVDVVCDSNDPLVAATLTTASEYALVVWGDSMRPREHKNFRNTQEVIICAAFITKSDVDALTAMAQCKTYLRAGAICMRRYFKSQYQSEQLGFRELNGVRVLDLISIEEQRLTATAKAAKRRMWGFLAIRSYVGESLS